MKRFATLTLVLSFVLGLYGFANAHGDAHRDGHGGAQKTLMGTISTVTETQIVVTAEGEGDVPVKLSASTRYDAMGESKGAWADLHMGMRVIIEFAGEERVAGEVSYRREAPPANSGEAGDE